MVSFIYASMAAALCAMASLTSSVDALDKQLYGLNYDLRQGPDWDPAKCKTATTIAKDLKTLSTVTKRVRTYALTDCDVRPVLTEAKKNGMTVWLGIWVSADQTQYDNEVAMAQKLLDEGLIDSNVVGFNVGSEAVYRGDITAEQAVTYITDFKGWLKKNSLTIPVAVTDIIDTMIAHPEIVEAGDVVTINQFPFWEKIDASEAAAQFKTRIQPLLKLAAGKDVYITETGWSSGGSDKAASDASPASAGRYLNDFYQLATAQGWKYYYFQGFDSEYKALLEGESDTVEAYFGLFSSAGVMKSAYADLKIGDLKTVSKETSAPKASASSSGKSSSKSSGKASGKSSGTGSSAGTSSKAGTDETDDGPGKVNAGSGASAVDATNSSSSTTTAKNSTSKTNSTNSTTKTNAAGVASTSVLASTLSAVIVLASVVLVSL